MIAWLDIPPVWLALALLLGWLQGAFAPLGLAVGGTAPFGAALALTGLIIMALAVWEMVRQNTTLIPRREASRLVTSGVFALSRNPIYLGDALVLAGGVLFWGALPSILLVPAFMWLISWRFIEGEEAALSAVFGEEFEAYRKETRRWL